MSNQITFSSEDYLVPEWSSKPTHPCHFEIIKDGSFLNTLPIKDKQFHLIGRLQDLCDIFIDNPTVSRKHAILQFKDQEPNPYLFDLGGTHGTLINKNKLPSKVYQKLQPYDTIKFGISSRSYVFRCPELQKQQQEEELKNQNKFMNILAERNQTLTKQELKDKYLEMLENDPYHKANNQPKKLYGKEGREVDGVDWGIGDQFEIYAYKNENEFTIEPDIVRRLPGLDQNQLNKIAQYEGNLRKYQEIEGELNELGNKERRQFGLEEKQRDKKQKFQRKFVEAVEALEKSEDWIRGHIFGEEQIIKKTKHKVQEIDSFEGDQFLDRTLQKKSQQIEEKPTQMVTTIDYWKLDKEFKEKVSELYNLTQQHKKQTAKPQNEGEDDELDKFMNENNKSLQLENNSLYAKRKEQLQTRIDELRGQLGSIMSEKDIKKLQNKILHKIDSEVNEEEVQEKKKKENHHRIQNTLNRLDEIREQQQEIDEEDIRIFQHYKPQLQEHPAKESGKRPRYQQQQPSEIFQKPVVKYPQPQAIRDLDHQQAQFQDLTKYK